MINFYNLSIIFAELFIVLVTFMVLHWLLNWLFKKSYHLSWLKDKKSSINNIRKISKKILAFSWFILSLAIILFNVFLIYRGEQNLPRYTLELFQNIPKEFWQTLLYGIFISGGLIIVTLTIIRYLDPLLKKAGKRVKDFAVFAKLTSVYDQTDAFLEKAQFHFTNTLWLVTLYLSGYFFKLPQQGLNYLRTLLIGYLIIALSILTLQAATAIIDSLDNLVESYFKPETLIYRYYSNLKHLVPFAKRCLEALIYVNMVTQVISLIQTITGLANVGEKLVNLIVIILLSRVFIELVQLLLEEVMLTDKNLSETQQQRRMTITPLLQSLSKYLIYFGAGVWILDVFEIDPTPILAAAGLLGLAVGLGAQNLINDMVSGFFILFENYYLVGDFIETGDASGVVEAIELRTTRIRHPNGQVYIIRNGNIEEVVNYSRDYIYAVVDIPISYEANVKKIYGILQQVSEELQANYPEVLEPIDFNGIEEFTPSHMTIRTMTKLKPTSNPRGIHDEIQGVVRDMIKEAFDKSGIPPLLPQRIIRFKSPEDGKIDLLKPDH
ncbi:mechanosensitive ion channel family protein [Roseofilum capinflatum]|uniref:Mechanosensitive ion channel family protein n=1 Tax=Roseofilum capinflatum BLCC-M114 TaxID=3022440 RepID=A0ABT7B4Q0_9CYAN|nr:mechanosensitive ion channel family protein [Roseofilum capinflatum]MDJ1174153.1 mechanosensitive ion channel family protein [Roseofilum capinflatum BLCC-M114]